MAKILFLDDMKTRHAKFRELTINSGHDIRFVFTAADAIAELNQGGIIQAFLDHDLSEEDIMCAPGDVNAKVPTGMTVVDHILTMDEPPLNIIVHSMNTPAAEEMCARLRQHRINDKKPTLMGKFLTPVHIPFGNLAYSMEQR